MIPKIIHQYWDGKISEHHQQLMDSIRNINTDYKYYLWNKDLVLKNFSNHKLIPYLKASSGLLINSDIARIILLDSMGGIYLDSDMLAINPIPDHILIHDCFACYENEYHLGQCIANGAIGSIARSIFIQSLINEILEYNIKNISTIKSTSSYLVFGPCLWTKKFFDLNCGHIIVYPSWYFIPYHYADKNKILKGYITKHIWHERYTKGFPNNKKYAYSFIDRDFFAIQKIKKCYTS